MGAGALSTAHAAFLARDRLTERIIGSFATCRGVALLAGAGYGKTWQAERCAERSGMECLWVDLGGLGRDPLRFARELFAAASRSGPAPWPAPRGVSRGSSARAGALAALELAVSGPDRRPGDGLLVVLDGLEQVDPAGDLAACLEHLLRRLPPSWRVLCLGREEPWSGELARAIQYGEVEVVGEPELALTVPEVGRLLEAAGWRLGPQDAGRVHAATLGWVAGVNLIARAGRRSLMEGAGVARITAGYFRRDVVRGLGEGLRDFMAQTAVLPDLDPALCDRLRQAGDSGRLLRELADRHLVARLGEEPGAALGYHPLLRAFLLGELRAEQPAAAVRRLEQRAAALLARAGRLDEAVDRLVAASDWRGLAALMRQHAHALFHRGQAGAVLSWLERVPPPALAEWPWLLVCQARARRQLGLPDGPVAALRRARHLFARHGDGDGAASALLEEAKQLGLCDELPAARRLCVAALELASDPQVKVEIMARVALDSALLGDLEEARRAGQDALDLLPALHDLGTTATDHVFVGARLGLTEALGGDFGAGLRRLEATCRAAEAEAVGVVSGMLARYLLGYVSARAGDFEVALRELARAGSEAESLGIDEYVRLSRGARAEALANLGRLEEAEEQFRLAGWVCNRWVDPGYFYLRTGQHQQAAEIYESDMARAAAVGDPLDRARAQAMLGVCLAAMGSPERGRRLLEQGERAHALRGFQSRTPGIRLHLSDLAFQAGSPGAGETFLRQALGAAQAGGAHHFFAFLPEVAGRGLRRARRMGLQPGFVAECEARLARLAGPGGEPGPAPPGGILAACGDERIRADLERSLASGRLTARGLRRLLEEYGLTWRESQVFVRYYLPDGDSGPSSRQRSELAAQLGIAEHTVRHHVNSIRGKLGLGAQRGMAAYRWALSREIVSA